MRSKFDMQCLIVSPTESSRLQDVTSVTLPAQSGEMEVLPGHAEAFLLLTEGVVRLQMANGESREQKIAGGECHVRRDEVVIFV